MLETQFKTIWQHDLNQKECFFIAKGVKLNNGANG